MKVCEEKDREQWGSRIGFVLAAAGSAIGLGNLWRFPVEAGRNGGGAFVLLYFVILLVIGFTLMLAELTLGRFTGLNPVGAYRKIKKNWAFAGGIGILAGFLILSFYSVIGGWVIHYAYQAATGAFQSTETSDFGGMFDSFITSTWPPIGFHAVFMLLTLAIVIGGIKNGIEKFAKILMPALLIMMIILMIRSLTLEGAWDGINFFLAPDFSEIDGKVFLSALGQVFFSLSLGMGAMITYGSYLSKDENVKCCSAIVPLLDTAIALLAGLTILPAVFAFGFEPDTGPGLMFVTLPAVFSQLPAGNIFGTVFFMLVLFAALSSSISLLEVCVSYFVDEWKLERTTSTIFLTIAIFLMGIPSSLGLGHWSEVKIIGDKGILDSVDFFACNILLPLGGLFLCIFIGWVWGLQNEKSEAIRSITNDGKISFPLAGVWIVLIKYVVPVAILAVFINGLS